MAQAIAQGQDLHLALAADLAGVTYERALELKAAKDKQILKLRKLAKVPNFGLPGGLSASGLVAFAKSGYDLTITEKEAEDLKRAWFARWPEMRGYFDHIKERVNVGHIIQHYSGRRRGGVGFTDGANTYFQGLVADGAKSALYDVVRASWMEPKSPLYGARPVLFIHDEIICEVELSRAPAAADELARLMLKGIKPFVPDLPILAEAWCSRLWRKGLEEMRDDYGVHIVQ
jgi:DNA polymerase I-like protein with 3'-5' exonuclease and polymerase domains